MLNPQVIARKRPDQVPVAQLDVVAVRWVLDPVSGFPGAGFTVNRSVRGAMTPLVIASGAPGAQLSATGAGWIIDPVQLADDARLRRTLYAGTPVGPYLPDPGRVAALLPLLTFALETPDLVELNRLLPDLINDVFGASYAEDLQLTAKYWPRSPAPTVAALLAMAHSAAPLEIAIYADVVAYYRRTAVADLLARASDFGFAKFLGLGIDDVLPAGTALKDVYYILDVVLAAPPARPQVSTAVNGEKPKAPVSLAATQTEGSQGYEDFSVFFKPPASSPPWRVPRPAAWPADPRAWPVDLESLARSAELGPRRASPIVSLTWSPPKPGDEMGILSYGPVLWRVERADFGAASAAEVNPPPLGHGEVYTVCADGDRARLASAIAPFLDDVGPRWGERAMEGWYAYRVSSIDVFGIVGRPCAPIPVRLRDETGPPPPLPSLDRAAPPNGMRIEIPLGASRTSVPLALDWGWIQERAGPDAVEFRIRSRMRPLDFGRVSVIAILPAPDPLNAVRCVVRLADEAGVPLAPAHLASLVGKALVTRTTEHPIVDVHPTVPSAVQVRFSVGRPPPRGVATVRASGDPTPYILHCEPRQPARTAIVAVTNIAPLRVRLSDPISGATILPEDTRVYLHLFGAAFPAHPSLADEFVLDEVHLSAPVAGALAVWRALAAADALAALNGSPAVILPPQPVLLEVDVPATFDAGLLEIDVSAADGVFYQGAPGRPGNEGASARLMVTLARLERPTKPAGPPPKLWAKGAAEYMESAVAHLTWPAIPRAARYEIERLMETALGLAPNASDDDLIEAAGDPAANAAFERCATPAMGATYEDTLPGRAPTRVVYRVRAVTAAEVHGEWGLVALVRIPDVRVPPPPNLTLARAPNPAEDRALDLQWTQAGGLGGIGFLVEIRRQGQAGLVQEKWDRLAEFQPGMLPQTADGRFLARVHGVVPGPRFDLRVSAVRHALDPRDPIAQQTRRIVGYPSAPLSAVALGELRAPTNITATALGGLAVMVRWINADDYEGIEIRRRPPDATGFRRHRLPKGAKTFSETLDRPGTWTYQLLAIGVGASARSLQINIDVPAAP